MQELSNNMKNIIYAIIGVIVLYFTIQLATSNPKIPKELKASIDSLTVVNKKLMESQQHMDSAIVAYENEVTKVDNQINNIKEKTTIIKEYFHEVSQQVDTYTPTELDSFFKARYNY
jgi:hypothetical protein